MTVQATASIKEKGMTGSAPQVMLEMVGFSRTKDEGSCAHRHTSTVNRLLLLFDFIRLYFILLITSIITRTIITPPPSLLPSSPMYPQWEDIKGGMKRPTCCAHTSEPGRLIVGCEVVKW